MKDETFDSIREDEMRKIGIEKKNKKMKKILIFVLFFMLISSIIYAADINYSPDYSHDPNDFILVMGTVWKFNYTYYYSNRTKYITCDNQIITNFDKSIGLICTDGDSIGSILFCNFLPPVKGRGYVCGFHTSSNYQFYLFNIDGNSAIGNFIYYTQSDLSDLKI